MSLTNKTPEHQVASLFNRIAGNYDQMNNLITLGTHKHWRTVTMQQLNLKPGSFAIDLCCGTGDWTLALAKAVGPSGRVVGLDFSDEMLAIAKQKVAQAGYQDRVTLIQAMPCHCHTMTTSLMSLPSVSAYATCQMPTKCCVK